MSVDRIQKKAVKLTDKIEELPKKLDKAEAQAKYPEEIKENKQKKIKEWKEDVENSFSELEDKLQDEKQKAKKKIKELNSGSYEQRQYEYSKASEELSNYDDPVRFLQNKAEQKNDNIAFSEQSKAALEKARANGNNGKVEAIKDIIAQNLGEKERKARKRIAKADILKKNLSGAKQTIKMDAEKIKRGDIGTTRKCVAAYLNPGDLDKVAEKKLFETLE